MSAPEDENIYVDTTRTSGNAGTDIQRAFRNKLKPFRCKRERITLRVCQRLVCDTIIRPLNYDCPAGPEISFNVNGLVGICRSPKR